jgi:hypothetical protein
VFSPRTELRGDGAADIERQHASENVASLEGGASRCGRHVIQHTLIMPVAF